MKRALAILLAVFPAVAVWTSTATAQVVCLCQNEMYYINCYYCPFSSGGCVQDKDHAFEAVAPPSAVYCWTNCDQNFACGFSSGCSVTGISLLVRTCIVEECKIYWANAGMYQCCKGCPIFDLAGSPDGARECPAAALLRQLNRKRPATG